MAWRWIFWLNVPLTLVVPAIGARSITESFGETVPRRIDVTGLALITVGIGLFTLTFDRAPTWGWLSALEMLQRAGMSPAGAVDAIVVVLAALLLPAGVVVLLIARASNSGTGT